MSARELAKWEQWFGFNTMLDRELVSMLTEAARFVQEIKANPNGKGRWLSLLGSSGTGKTFLAKRVMRWIREQGARYTCFTSGASLARSYSFTYWPEFIQEGREGDFSRKADMAGDWFACIDELSADKDRTGWIADSAAYVAGKRVDKWTLFTSNLTGEEIAQQIDTRVISRMTRDRNRVCVVSCQDYALRPK